MDVLEYLQLLMASLPEKLKELTAATGRHCLGMKQHPLIVDELFVIMPMAPLYIYCTM